MLAVITAGVAPGFALLSFFYLKDEFEKEPILDVLRVFFLGAVLVFPIMFIQYILEVEGVITNPFLRSFISASFLEEFFKWFILYFIAFRLIDFDEHYDGIVYGASISLGFATVENILYLLGNGLQYAFGRAILPVSSHALFGVVMGSYIGKAKFSDVKSKNKLAFLSFFIPFLLHGVYDLFIIVEKYWVLLILPFMIFLWWLALRKVKRAKQTHPYPGRQKELNQNLFG